jgi:hypothetical protein
MSLDTQSAGDSSGSNSLKPITKKLNKTNFSTWRYTICNALAYQDLDGFIKEHTPALKARPDYEAKVKKVTTFIRLHLGYKDSSCFVDDLDVYDPKALWDAILKFHAARTVENAANVMEPLHNIVFVKGEMQKNINLFCQTFQLMIEVSSNKFDKKTLEAVWVFFVLKHLPQSYHMFRSLQFASFKTNNANVKMSKFLTELETKLQRQQESAAQLAVTASALAVQRAPAATAEKKRQLFCSNGVHNPECTGHTPA